MAGTPYLVDSNILLRWVKPDHNDYPLVVSAIDAILRGNDVLDTLPLSEAATFKSTTRFARRAFEIACTLAPGHMREIV